MPSAPPWPIFQDSIGLNWWTEHKSFKTWHKNGSYDTVHLTKLPQNYRTTPKTNWVLLVWNISKIPEVPLLVLHTPLASCLSFQWQLGGISCSGSYDHTAFSMGWGLHDAQRETDTMTTESEVPPSILQLITDHFQGGFPHGKLPSRLWWWLWGLIIDYLKLFSSLFVLD